MGVIIWNTKNKHLVHKEAIRLVIQSLPGSVDMDSVAGYYSPYDVEWRNIKILVRVARPSKKSSQKRAKWFYTLRKKDHQVADYFVLFALVGNKVGAVYVLPKVFVPAVFITITKLDGNIRYDYFKTDLPDLAEKIKKVQVNLPKLIQIHRKAKILKGGEQ